MRQSTGRTYLCQVTLTIGGASTRYKVTKVEGGWRFDRPDGIGYSVGTITDARNGSRRLGCTCPDHRARFTCNHAAFVHMFADQCEAETLYTELRNKHDELMEEGHLLDQATSALAALRASVEDSNPYARTADFYPAEFALNAKAPPPSYVPPPTPAPLVGPVKTKKTRKARIARAAS